MARRGRLPLGANEMKTLLLTLLLAVAGEDAGVRPPVYVQGSSLNLRRQACKDAEVLVQAPIGTECAVVGEAPTEWMQVRCGDFTGYVAAALVGPDKPSVEKLRAEAHNPVLTPERREESALRASLLAPEDAELSKLLGDLFIERNFRLTERFKPPANAVRRTFSNTCGWRPVDVCIQGVASSSLRDVKVRTVVKKNLYIVAVKDAENITVYRGRFTLDPATATLTAEVLERSTFARTPAMDRALFTGVSDVDESNEDIPFGRFFLDDTSYAALNDIPHEWALLKRDAEGFLMMPYDDCLKRPYQLEFHSDIHGRWFMLREHGGGAREAFWITSAVRRGNEVELSLAEIYGNAMSRMTLKLPEGKKDMGSLNDMLYTFKLQRYPPLHDNCKEGGP